MSEARWWASISEAELLELRQRLAAYLRRAFRPTVAAEIDDLVQQAFVTLFRRAESVSAAEDGLFRYLKSIARNAAIDRIRQRRPRVAAATGPLVSPESGEAVRPPVLAALEHAEEADKFRKIFCALDELERLVVWSHVVEGRSVRQIAKELDLNWHRVARMIESALRQIRRELGER